MYIICIAGHPEEIFGYDIYICIYDIHIYIYIYIYIYNIYNIYNIYSGDCYALALLLTVPITLISVSD